MKQIMKKFSLLRTGLFILCVSAIAISCGETESTENVEEAVIIEEPAPPPPPPAPDTTVVDTSAESRPVPIKKG
jgi:hypothetical protein